MTKVKIRSSARKRFQLSASGKILRKKAYKSHLLTKKAKKRKRNLGKKVEVSKADLRNVKKLLCL